ncbi:MAG: hypothetical protein FJ071_06200 [Cyanobacteria bacterium M_DeepCast_200m_mx_001]|nr:hypothetical protein [Cyanobacteria bacterium M_DeepCast_200m_mx_001]
MVADTGLRLRESVRRNGEGSLWRPRWWPADLAPLFWPLLLALALAALVALGVGLARLRPALPVAVAPVPEPVAVAPSQPELQPAPQPEPEPEPAAERVADPQVATSQAAEPPEETPELEPPAPPPPDPLVLLLQRPGADGLIRSAVGDVEASSLSLQLAPAFPALAPREQQRRATLWLGWARDLGYDHLELRDSRAGLLARDALVGDGMILFSSEPSA